MIKNVNMYSDARLREPGLRVPFAFAKINLSMEAAR
jgi:hypothetical protein